MGYYSRTTYQVVQTNDDGSSTENEYDNKEEALICVQEIIDDGYFDETHIVINEINENNYASCDDQYTENEVFECRAFYDGDEIKLDISNNEIGFVEAPNNLNTWNDLMQYQKEHEKDCEVILDYDIFSVVKIQNRYFYYTMEEEFAEVEIVAKLTANLDVALCDHCLQSLCDSFCCGEKLNANEDGTIDFLWFNEVKGE